MMGFGFGLGGVGMILFWLVIAALAVLLIRSLINKNGDDKETPRDESRKSTGEILQRRYASGEITREEFNRMRHELHDA